MKQFLRKHLPDQPFSRSTKPDLSDELQEADRKVETIKVAVNAVCKRLGSMGGSSGGASGQPVLDSARDKRTKKLLEHQLGTAMLEAINHMKDERTSFKYIMELCGRTEVTLANEIIDHENKVEQLVCQQLYPVVEQDLPNIVKAKKQLSKLLNEKENAYNRLSTQTRQGEQLKIALAQEEVEEAEVKADQSLDALAAEMFSLIIKESKLAGAIVQFVKLQRAYHEDALHTLTSILPPLEEYINDFAHKPVFGISLEQHLIETKRDIAFPIEICVCALHELGLREEGLFRMVASSSRMKRMKLSVDAGLLHENSQLPQEYRDVHVIGGVLKCYLRELPEPLLTTHFHDKLISAIVNNNSEEARINELNQVIHQLPKPNFNNLRYLIKFLSILSQHHSENKMTPSNIAIVIAPNLLWSTSDGTSIGYDMSKTASINCIVELLVKHADRFFKEDVNFFVSINKENLLYDDGFPPQFGKGSINGKQCDASSMSKSMHEYQPVVYEAKPSGHLVHNKQSHSRSNSHDTSLILLDNDIKRTQSNSSLSDVSSQPQGSPKPNSRTKKNKLAPVPPNFTPPDKSNHAPKTVSPDPKMQDLAQTKESKDTHSKNDFDKPDKPPRPVAPEATKIISGSQTINRSNYKTKIGNLGTKIGQKLSSSRENLAEFASSIKERRKSLEFEHESVGGEIKHTENIPLTNSASTHHSSSSKVSEGCQTASSISPRSSLNAKTGSVVPKQIVQTQTENIPKPMPVAAPRTYIMPKQDATVPADKETSDVQLRQKPIPESTSVLPGGKPAIPERPATLRPQSFRNSGLKNQSLEMLASIEVPQNGMGSSGTMLERTHLYTVDKQHPTIIQVGNSQQSPGLFPDPATLSPDEGNKLNIQRTHSIGSNNQNSAKSETQPIEHTPLMNQMRKLSQSEGNILDVPPSPRPYHKPPRPQIPAPPPPTMVPKPTVPESSESTDL